MIHALAAALNGIYTVLAHSVTELRLAYVTAVNVLFRYLAIICSSS